MRHRLWFLLVLSAVTGFSVGIRPAGGAETGSEPLWNAAVITDTQTLQVEWITALISRLEEVRPEVVIHTGDTDFLWADSWTFKAVADLVHARAGSAEFHLAPGNHDVHGGILKAHLREAATEGIFRLERAPTFGGAGYLSSRVAAYITGPRLPVWNPEILDHPGWQSDSRLKSAGLGRSANTCRYVFRRGGIRFIVCDWCYSRDQKDWLRQVITEPDDSSVSIVLHHSHEKLTRYFDGLEGRHNVKLVLSGHDHKYRRLEKGGITYITGAGIAKGNRGDCDAMVLRVYGDRLVLARYLVPKGGGRPIVEGPESIWTCEGQFGRYEKPVLSRPEGVFFVSSDGLGMKRTILGFKAPVVE